MYADKINIALPSLRVDNFSDELMQKLNSVRRSGLTFAPEAGSQRLRNVINKGLTEEVIINGHSINAAQIDVADLNLTNRIAFTDLDSETRTRIDENEVPEYIKSTYIDATQVQSPTITGNNINVRNNGGRRSGGRALSYMRDEVRREASDNGTK